MIKCERLGLPTYRIRAREESLKTQLITTASCPELKVMALSDHSVNVELAIIQCVFVEIDSLLSTDEECPVDQQGILRLPIPEIPQTRFLEARETVGGGLTLPRARWT
jgi:hypothetical protein